MAWQEWRERERRERLQMGKIEEHLLAQYNHTPAALLSTLTHTEVTLTYTGRHIYTHNDT